ncbi:DUF397 domain-containing protein [Streptomyces sp. NPDC021212]|uniref:DUF397 domain-containing protein n=1 Tax=Streptomyces sp. NPDC021212 TaxID=3365118 RepID=UPI0037953757
MSTELAWFKSSYSTGDGDSCVEVALSWHKSTRSANGSGCVEVAACPDTIHIRDSKDKQGPQLAFSPTAWTAFVAHTTADQGVS